MKNFFSIFFKKKEEVTPLSFQIIDAIYDYLYYQNSSFQFKMKEIDDVVYINRYTFPSSFNHPEGLKEINGCGFNNPYEVLNALYKKMDIGELSEETLTEDLEFDCIHVQFYSEATSISPFLKRILQNFFFFFCCKNGSATINGFRILYSSNRYFSNFTKDLLETKYFTLESDKEGIEAIAWQDVQKVVIAACQQLNITLPEALSTKDFSLEEVTVAHVEEFLQLITRNTISELEVKLQAENIFSNPQDDESDFIEDNYEFLENVKCWNSDWKFDPEDAEYFISEILNQEFTFEYPEDTYSHDLFPYLQAELAKQELELMTFDTHGDSYLFFVANKNEVSRLVELGKMIAIPIEKL